MTNTVGPIPFYHKANWDSMTEEMSGLLSQIEGLVADNAFVEGLWQCFKFKTGLQDSVHRHVSHKTLRLRRKASYPWKTPELQKLLCKRDRKYPLKKLGTEELNTEVKNLKREVQKKLCWAYWDHVGKLFTPTGEE